MTINFIAVLDHHHLENSVFLTAFAKSLAQLGDRKGIVIHGDSPYTDRLIQTGMMREDARLRAIKDLNKRLIGLFADQGIPTIGIHGYQKGLVRNTDKGIDINLEALEDLHEIPNLLISNLVEPNTSSEEKDPDHVPLPQYVKGFSNTFKDAEVFLFSMNEKDEIIISESHQDLEWEKLPETISKESIPEEFREYKKPVKITTATDFANWPNLKKVTRIK